MYRVGRRSGGRHHRPGTLVRAVLPAALPWRGTVYRPGRSIPHARSGATPVRCNAASVRQKVRFAGGRLGRWAAPAASASRLPSLASPPRTLRSAARSALGSRGGQSGRRLRRHRAGRARRLVRDQPGISGCQARTGQHSQSGAVLGATEAPSGSSPLTTINTKGVIGCRVASVACVAPGHDSTATERAATWQTNSR